MNDITKNEVPAAQVLEAIGWSVLEHGDDGWIVKRYDRDDDGELVDVTAVSKGKGFAGAMKRHGFGGQRASHGAHKVHRKPGAVGQCATPARIFKGKKMPGRMGHNKVTTLNLQVVKADAERDLLLVKGSVPGPRGGTVVIRNAVKAPAGGDS